MADIAWPADLPKRPMEGGWSVEIVDPVARNQPDRGPVMSRLAATIKYEIFSGTYRLTRLQYDKLIQFYETDTDFGTTDFNAFHWVKLEESIVLHFLGPPNVEHIAGKHFMVSMSFCSVP